MNSIGTFCVLSAAAGTFAMGQPDRSRSLTDAEILRFYGSPTQKWNGKSQRDELTRWKQDIAAAPWRHPLEAIPHLSGIMLKLSNWNSFQVPERIAVYDAAQATLVAIPGHAEYYRDKILQARERLKNPGGGTTGYEYDVAIRKGFAVFHYLHSPEGVRVLGEMLTDDWVPPGNEKLGPGDKYPQLSANANAALANFPLKDKPLPNPLTYKNYDIAHPAWQHWYEQIKSGSRTFRFEGDPTEYDLNGPALGQKLAHISRNQNRDDERATGHDRTAGTPAVAESGAPGKASNPMSVAAFAAVTAVLFSLGWYFLRRRKAA